MKKEEILTEKEWKDWLNELKKPIIIPGKYLWDWWLFWHGGYPEE